MWSTAATIIIYSLLNKSIKNSNPICVGISENETGLD